VAVRLRLNGVDTVGTKLEYEGVVGAENAPPALVLNGELAYKSPLKLATLPFNLNTVLLLKCGIVLE
jgi:hypothetical protein